MKILETKISSTLAVLSFCLVPGSAAKAATAEDCANLAKLAAGNTTITSASLIPAGGALPEYCRVQGRVDANQTRAFGEGHSVFSSLVSTARIP